MLNWSTFILANIDFNFVMCFFNKKQDFVLINMNYYIGCGVLTFKTINIAMDLISINRFENVHQEINEMIVCENRNVSFKQNESKKNGK